MHRIGAHVSVAKGLMGALTRAEAIGANCLQIFSASPRSFGNPKFSDEECIFFKNAAHKKDIGPNFIHACYLINLGSDNAGLRARSVKSLIDDLNFAEKIGARGDIVHTGSHKGKGLAAVLPDVVDSIKKILAATPESTKVYLEIASGSNGKIGNSLLELQEILSAVSSNRVGVCLDTAHLFAGGIAFDTPEKIELLAQMIESTVGWEVIECIHTNDNKGDFGSAIDRHENIGKGFIGEKSFQLLLHHRNFSKIPFIMEVPGFDDKGPDKKNIDILKSLI